MNTPFIDPNQYRIESLFLSSAHIVSLIIFICFCWLLYLHRGKSYMKHFRWILIVLLILSEISLTIWSIHYGKWSVRFNLPLNLCTISLYLSAYMLLAKSYRVFEIIYFFGIGGALQALLTPDLFYTFPHYRFLHFFIAHMAIILAILYMIWVLHFKITFHSLIKSFVTLNGIAFIAFLVNTFTGSNYMYLAHKPKGPSLIDLLGPYPWYILSLEIIAFIIFLLLYLPFHNKRARKRNKKDK